MSCIDCPEGSKRPTTRPGPRCATHQRERKKASKITAHEAYLLRTYKMPHGTYDKLLAFQDGYCYICRRANGRTKKLAVDHDHSCCPSTPTCGECTRGLLCGPCNKLLGHVRDSWAALQRGASYLLAPPFKRMRERER